MKKMVSSIKAGYVCVFDLCIICGHVILGAAVVTSTVGIEMSAVLNKGF
jgi:hypothetical protein